MPRRPIKKKRSLLPDPVYDSLSVHMLVNRVMKNGKKSLAYRIVYKALREVGDITKTNPVEVFEQALENVTPKVEVKPRRRAGSVQLVPRVLRSTDRAKANGLGWILEVCKKKTGVSMVTKLKNEIIEAYKKTGLAIRKRDELHKTALSNAMYAKRPQVVLSAIN
uniref:Small ribosomal subunit protein uS7c n=1 Tax=Jenufa perforata TaxID=993091 RepID=A0A0S2LNT2_9CHLO|nr:ribosomal protein S7 [Jenufa perforata]ALO62902.1 ribosomal protein S7 [Jenufa perforata]